MNESSERPAEFDGQCAFALSTGKKGVEGQQTLYAIQDGKKYLFSNPVAKFLWRVLPGREKKARRTWSER